MTIATGAFDESLRSLHEAAVGAASRAARVRRPVLAVASACTSAPEDLLPLPGRWRPGAVTFFWERPADTSAVLGLGTAMTLRASGAKRFASLKAAVKRLTETAVMAGEAPAGTPMLVGGLGFGTMQSPDGVWCAFPPAFFFVPRVLVARRNGGCVVRLALAVDPDTDVAVQVARIGSEIERFLADSESPADSSAPSTYAMAHWPPVDEWVKSAGAVLDDIHAGHLDKLVLARTCTVQADRDFDTVTVVRRLRHSYPMCTAFWLAHEGSHFAGATPEMLVTLRRRQVETSAVAGSAPRGCSPETDRLSLRRLRDSAKDRLEHDVVVDAIAGALRPLCESVTVAPEAQVLTLENVHHLRTPISARVFEAVHLLDLVEALHPTPAVAGHPRAAALAALRRHEPFDRGWYAAPVGWIGADGSGEMAVAIRCALLNGAQALLYAGAGLVRGSDPDAELAETELKMAAVLNGLVGRA